MQLENNCQKVVPEKEVSESMICGMKSLPCPCGQRFSESQEFVEHARSCSLFAMTASSFAEAAKAVNTSAPDQLEADDIPNRKSVVSPNILKQEADDLPPTPYLFGRGALDLTSRGLPNIDTSSPKAFADPTDTKLPCPECKASFASQSALIKHFDKDHNVRGSYSCKCGTVCDNLSTYLSHQLSCLSHTDIGMKTQNLSCTYCGQSGFQMPVDLLNHMNSCGLMNSNDGGNMFPLPASFVNQFDSKLPHPSMLRRGGDQSFPPPTSTGLLPPNLMPNFLNSNNANPALINSPNLKQMPKQMSNQEIRQGNSNHRNHKSNDIVRDSVNNGNGNNNCNSNADISRPFKCDHCVKSFKSKALLDQHMHIHFPPKYTCRYCSKKYRWPPVFYHHQRTCKKRSQPPVTTAPPTGPPMVNDSNRLLNTKANMASNAYDFGRNPGSKAPYLPYRNGGNYPNPLNNIGNGNCKTNSLMNTIPITSNPTSVNNLPPVLSDMPMLANKPPNFMAMMAAASMGLRFPWVPPLGMNNLNGSLPSGGFNPIESIGKQIPLPPPITNAPIFNWKSNTPMKSNENGGGATQLGSLTKCLCGANFDDFASYFSHIGGCKQFSNRSGISSISNNLPPPYNYIQNLLDKKSPDEKEQKQETNSPSEEDKPNLNSTASMLASMLVSMNSNIGKPDFNISNLFNCMQNIIPTIGNKRPHSPSDQFMEEEESGNKMKFDHKNVTSHMLNDMASVLANATSCVDNQKHLSGDSMTQNLTSSSSSCGDPSTRSPDVSMPHSGGEHKSCSDNSDHLDTTGSHPSSPITTSDTICKLCSKDCVNKQALCNHYETKHLKERKYKCPGCSQYYNWGASYYHHRKLCPGVKELGLTGNAISPEEEELFECLRGLDSSRGAGSFGSKPGSTSLDNVESSSDAEIDRSPYDERDLEESDKLISKDSAQRRMICSPSNPISALGDMLVE